MRYFMLLFVMIIFWPGFVLADPELKGSPAELTNYLSSLPEEVAINGEAKLEIQADSGIVSIGIKTQDPALKKSLQLNQALRNQITARLISSGISQDKIKGTKFSSTPEYGFFGKKPNNYVVENKLKIIVENENQLQAVAGIVDNHREVFYQGIELKEQKKEEIKNQLLNMALANAKERQKVYEAQLGIVLKPIGFQENISVVKRPVPQKRLYQAKMAVDSVSNESYGSNNLSLGEHVYHGNVHIRYQVMAQ